MKKAHKIFLEEGGRLHELMFEGHERVGIEFRGYPVFDMGALPELHKELKRILGKGFFIYIDRPFDGENFGEHTYVFTVELAARQADTLAVLVTYVNGLLEGIDTSYRAKAHARS